MLTTNNFILKGVLRIYCTRTVQLPYGRSEYRLGYWATRFLLLLTVCDASSFTEFTNRVVLAQSIMFLIAGNDTVSTALFFVSHLLAQHPDQQQRLRLELQTLVKEEGELTYLGIMEAKFLDACINGKKLSPNILLHCSWTHFETWHLKED